MNDRATPSMQAPNALAQVEVWFDGPLHQDAGPGPVLVGHIGRERPRGADILSFEYDNRWLSHPGRFALDQVLHLRAGRQYMGDGSDTGAVAPALQDCSPDRWGSVLMRRREQLVAREQGRATRLLRPWDFLLGVADSGRMGALRLRDPQSGRWLDDSDCGAPPMTRLAGLEAVARAVDAGRDLNSEEEAWLRALVAPGTSLGGARPKASFIDGEGALWLAKFPGADDAHDVGRWEYITWLLAGKAGVVMPPAQLLVLSDRGATFAVQRFDRDAHQGRVHYASAMTLLNVNQSEGYGYEYLAGVIEENGRAGAGGLIDQDLEQLFRRVVFNILVGNRDDHLRNHGFLRQADGWRLSPAFDVNPNPHKDVHVLGIADEDTTPDTTLALATCRTYRLTRLRAEQIAGQVRHALADWESLARANGARGHEIALMRTVIDPSR